PAPLDPRAGRAGLRRRPRATPRAGARRVRRPQPLAAAGRRGDRAGRGCPEPRRRLALVVPPPLGWRSRLELAVYLQVHALLVEAEAVADGLGVQLRLRIRPDEVVDHPVADPDRPVRGRALVGAAWPGRAGDEEGRADVLGGDVVPRRQAGLEEDLRTARVGENDAVAHHADVPRRLVDVDPAVRIARVTEQLVVLGEPLV